MKLAWLTEVGYDNVLLREPRPRPKASSSILPNYATRNAMRLRCIRTQMDGIGGHLAWKNLVRLCDFAHEYATRSRNLTPKLFVSREMREERCNAIHIGRRWRLGGGGVGLGSWYMPPAGQITRDTDREQCW